MTGTKSLILCAVMGLLVSLSQNACSSGSGASLGSVDGLASTDVSSYDYSLATASTSYMRAAKAAGKKGSSLSRDSFSMKKAAARTFSALPGEVGGFSRAGCESNSMKSHVFESSLQIEAMKCRIAAMEKAGLFEAPSETVQTYALGLPEMGNEAAQSIYFRMVKVGNELRLNMCNPRSGDPVQTEEMIFGITNGDFSFTVNGRHAETVTAPEGLEEAFPGGTFKDQFQMTGTADANDGDASFTGSFASTFTPTGLSETPGQKGRIAFTREKSSETNTVAGTFRNSFQGDDNTFGMYAKWNAAEGSAKFSGTGEFRAFPCPDYPGTPFSSGAYCCYDEDNGVLYNDADDNNNSDGNNASYDRPSGDTVADEKCKFEHSDTESFSIDVDLSGTDLLSTFTVVADADVPFYEAVAATDVTTTVPDVTFAWDYEWDCVATTAITGEDFANADGLEDDLAVCEEIQGKGFHGGNSCQQEEGEHEVE